MAGASVGPPRRSPASPSKPPTANIKQHHSPGRASAEATALPKQSSSGNVEYSSLAAGGSPKVRTTGGAVSPRESALFPSPDEYLQDGEEWRQTSCHVSSRVVPPPEKDLVAEPIIKGVLRHRLDHGLEKDCTHVIPLDCDTKRLAPRAIGRFEDWELCALKADALSDYHNIRTRVEQEDLLRDETTERQDLEDDAMFALEAIRNWQKEVHGRCFSGVDRRRALAMLEIRLQQCFDRHHYEHLKKEAHMREEGRDAWKAEVEEKARLAAESVERHRQNKIATDQYCGAVTFLVVEERKARGAIEEEEEQFTSDLLAEELAMRDTAQRVAEENFKNSPEQLALAAERDKKDQKAKRRVARQQRQHKADQQRLINNCHHGRGGSSMFTGPSPRQTCPQCRVTLDPALGYLVSMDAQRRSTVASGTQKRSSTAAPLPTKVPLKKPKKASVLQPADPSTQDIAFSSPIVITKKKRSSVPTLPSIAPAQAPSVSSASKRKPS